MGFRRDMTQRLARKTRINRDKELDAQNGAREKYLRIALRLLLRIKFPQNVGW